MNTDPSRRLVDMSVGELLAILDQRDTRLKESIISTINSDRVDTPEPLITAWDAAELLGLAKGTVMNKAAKGELPRVKVGGRVMFKRSELLQWAEQNRIPTNSEIESKADAYIERQRQCL